MWTFDTDRNNPDYMGQGNHSISVSDVDFDGKDEIIYGGAVIDDDGTGMYSTGLGHGDAQHIGDLIPSRPGLEIFSVHEESHSIYGEEMRDARTGEFIWGVHEEGADVGRGVSDDIDPRYPGCESWSSSGIMISAAGEIIAHKPSISQNFLIYWDGDLGRELQDGNHIDKWMPEKNKTNLIFSTKGYESNNGTKASPGITCDIFGDWREETIYFKKDDTSMAIFTTTIPTDYKIYTLMHDLQYRTYICTQNVGYNQPPHLGYYLGYDTTEIPVSRVKVHHNGKIYGNPDLEKDVKYYPIDTLKRDNSVAMKIGISNALVNDTMKKIDSDNKDIVPLVEKGISLVPLRFISEAFGAVVDWNEDKQQITIKDGGNTIKLLINSDTYTINQKEYKLDTPSKIIDDIAFVPFRAIAEALGKVVEWDNRGLIYISEEKVVLTENSKAILIDTLEKYVEPENANKEPAPIETEKLNEKQITIFSVESSSDDGNIAEGAVDGDLSTRWNAFGDGETLTLTFDEVKEVAAVAASYFKGDQRQYYFDIEISEDGKKWKKVLTNQSSSGTAENNQIEIFEFSQTEKALCIRYIGHGSSTNDSNNMWEFIALMP